MPVYLVACDTPATAKFATALKSYDGQELLGGVYLVDSPVDADILRQQLSETVGKGSRLWVSRITEDHSGLVMAPALEWLQRRRPL